MTLYGLIASLTWAALAAFVAYRTDVIATAWLTNRTPSEPQPQPVIPEDLVALAMNESETWAQDQILSTIQNRYVAFQDWNKVRAALGVGQVVS